MSEEQKGSSRSHDSGLRVGLLCSEVAKIGNRKRDPLEKPSTTDKVDPRFSEKEN
jgi:hypothetical protein